MLARSSRPSQRAVQWGVTLLLCALALLRPGAAVALQERLALLQEQLLLAVSSGGHQQEALRDLHAQNQALLLENTALRAMNRDTHTLLRAIDLARPQDPRYSHARIIRRAGGVSGSLRINKGRDHDVQPQSAVLTADGVLGLVDTVSSSWSEVIPLSAPRIAFDALLADSGRHALFIGDGQRVHSIDIPQTQPVRVGELVYASGEGGLLPPGYPIGHIDEVLPSVQSGFWRVTIALNATPALAQSALIYHP